MKNLTYLFVLLFFLSCQQNREEETPDNVFYTCSMDPQVMEKKPGKCPICKMELTKTIIDKKDSHEGLKINKEQEILANIKTMSVTEKEIGRQKIINGRIVVNENKVSNISSRITGRIEKLYIKNIGENIKIGTLLYEIYSEDLLAAQKEYLIALGKSKQFSSADINYNQLLEGAKTKLLLWGMTETQIKELSEKLILDNTTPIYSQKNGTVSTVNKRQGDYIMDGEIIFEIVDLSFLWVEAELYASEIADFSNNDQVTIRVQDFPGKEWKSRIFFTSPQLEIQSKINLIRAEILNTEMLLKPGIQASIEVKSTMTKSLVVPSTALLQDSQGATVWIRKKDGSFENRMVITGIENDDEVEIRAGLEPGEEVVISGAYLLNSEYIFKKGATPMEEHKM